MPEIDLKNRNNRDIFLSWFHGKAISGKVKRVYEGDLDTGLSIVADLIDGEPLNSYVEAGKRTALPEGFIKADVSDKHAKQLKKRGVVFERPKISEVLDKMKKQTEREVEEAQPLLAPRIPMDEALRDFNF